MENWRSSIQYKDLVTPQKNEIEFDGIDHTHIYGWVKIINKLHLYLHAHGVVIEKTCCKQRVRRRQKLLLDADKWCALYYM